MSAASRETIVLPSILLEPQKDQSNFAQDRSGGRATYSGYVRRNEPLGNYVPGGFVPIESRTNSFPRLGRITYEALHVIDPPLAFNASEVPAEQHDYMRVGDFTRRMIQAYRRLGKNSIPESLVDLVPYRVARHEVGLVGDLHVKELREELSMHPANEISPTPLPSSRLAQVVESARKLIRTQFQASQDWQESDFGSLLGSPIAQLVARFDIGYKLLVGARNAVRGFSDGLWYNEQFSAERKAIREENRSVRRAMDAAVKAVKQTPYVEEALTTQRYGIVKMSLKGYVWGMQAPIHMLEDHGIYRAPGSTRGFVKPETDYGVRA